MKKVNNNLIRSPLHYNGNKFDIVEQILNIIPNDSKRIVEIFSGTGIVSLNSKSHNIWLNDSDKNLISIINFIKNFSNDDLKKIISITNKYSLSSDMNNFAVSRINQGTKGYSQINKKGYLELRNKYNKSNKKSIYDLFVLINYSFNRMVRFNSKGEFNVPVGKGDLSHRQIKYLKEFQKTLNSKKIEVTNLDFRIAYPNISSEDFVYIDPPYLNGNAQYNSQWNENDENDLYEMIVYLNNKNIMFALSNTIFLNGKKNNILEKFIKDNNFKVHKIKKLYSKTSYNKINRYDAQEVLITNF